MTRRDYLQTMAAGAAAAASTTTALGRPLGPVARPTAKPA